MHVELCSARSADMNARRRGTPRAVLASPGDCDPTGADGVRGGSALVKV